MPEDLARELAEQTGNEALLALWRRSLEQLRSNIQTRRLSLTQLEPELAMLTPEILRPLIVGSGVAGALRCSGEQYARHIEMLRQLEKQHENLSVSFRSDVAGSTLLYVKEDACVIMAKIDPPMSAFVFNDPSMVNAFWDYVGKNI